MSEQIKELSPGISPDFGRWYHAVVSEFMVKPLVDGNIRIFRPYTVGGVTTDIYHASLPPDQYVEEDWKPSSTSAMGYKKRRTFLDVIAGRDEESLLNTSLPRTIIGHQASYLNASPRRIVLFLSGKAQSVTEMMQTLDLMESPEYADSAEFYDSLSTANSSASVKYRLYSILAQRSLELANSEENVNQLFEQIVDRKSIASIQNVVKLMSDNTGKNYIEDGNIWGPAPKAAADFFWRLEDEGFDLDLKTASGVNTIYNSAGLMAHPDFVELFLRHLTRRPVEVSKREERQSTHFARAFVKGMFWHYAADYARDAKNLNAIEKYLFPNEARQDSMSRDNAINLANQIVAKHGGKPINANDRGAFSEALEQILTITSAPRLRADEIERQRMQDRTYVMAVGMLLEQRDYSEA